MSNKQEEKVILQVKYPIITSYTSDSHMLAILDNYPSTKEWIFNQYINLWGEKPTCKNNFTMLRFHSWLIRRVCPYFKINYYDKTFFDSNVIEFIISKLDLGCYLTILYDQYYIPYTENYNIDHIEHEMLIYGYNRKLRVFYIADFFKDMKYSFEIVSFDYVKSAIINALESKLFSCSEIRFCDTDYKFSKYFLYNSLNNFLHSKNTVAENENVIVGDAELEEIQKGRYIFGMENYNLLKQTLSETVYDKMGFSNIRSLHVIFDHKVIMCERLRYLANKGIIEPEDPIINEYENICSISNANRNIFIKFILTKNYNLIDKIINNINEIKLLESEAISYLIGCVILDGRLCENTF